MRRLASASVAVVGIGGVGSWCAEALVRTGVGRIAIMDDDRIAPSNVNRQCPATSRTMGRPKVEAMRERLLEINPECEVEARYGRFTSGSEAFSGFDAVADAIDSVDCKAALILSALKSGVPVVSSMGAAFRTDPTKVRIKRFSAVSGDGLARALRRKFKALGAFPAAPFDCVVSDESPRPPDASGEKGSIMPVTAAFGMALASAIISVVVSAAAES